MATQYQDVLSAQDIAVYGGLCALASFDRSDLRSYVINNVSFRDYMEVNPEVMHTAFQTYSLLHYYYYHYCCSSCYHHHKNYDYRCGIGLFVLPSARKWARGLARKRGVPWWVGVSESSPHR